MITSRTIAAIVGWFPVVALAAGGLDSTELLAKTYYIDAVAGADTNSGLSPEEAWQSIGKVATAPLGAGDCVALRSGSVWNDPLVVKSSGSAEAPIRIDRYGEGPLPRIDAQGKAENAVALINVEYVELRHLEITNHGAEAAPRRGVLIEADNVGTLHHIVVSDLFVHDVNGGTQRKETGGILFRTRGERVPSRFDGLVIERNIIWKVDRSGIVAQSDQLSQDRWFPSLNVVIRDNYVEDIGGDGIVPWVTDGALIEHNIVRHAVSRAKSYNAGIWPWSTDNSLFQLNSASFTHGTLDGQGFDSDYNSRNSTYLYNYSHDNEGGFMLICTPAPDYHRNIGNIGTVMRYNISRHDRCRGIHLAGPIEEFAIENNVLYVAPGDDVQMVIATQWDEWPQNGVLRDNVFAAAGTARYGHQTGRTEGTYEIGPGFEPARDVRFEGNRYFGKHIDLPERTSDSGEYHSPVTDWSEPEFNVAQPEGLREFMNRHRQWMLRLFGQQFGEAPLLQTPTPAIEKEPRGKIGTDQPK